MSSSNAQLLTPLVEISRHYGSSPEWVLAGGGNTSFKTIDRLYVKASGFALGAIDASGFCEMDRQKLDAIWSKEYPDEKAAREDAALADLMAARVEGETKRPSVETLLHGFFPQAYVVHTHPALVNGLTCGMDGESTFHRLFGRDGIWVPLVDPGYTLAKTVKVIFKAFVDRVGRAPCIMFMQNHGLLVAGEDPEEIAIASAKLVSVLGKEVSMTPGASPIETAVAVDTKALGILDAALRDIVGGSTVILHRADRMILGFAADSLSFASISRPFSPDHIVYAGHEYLRIDDVKDFRDAWSDYEARNRIRPRIVLVRNLGAFATAGSHSPNAVAGFAAASRILDLFVDSCKVATYTRAFGGPRFMSPEAVAFIRNWEVEKYRSSIAVTN